MLAAWVEQNHDEKGVVWSPQIAPFDAHLVGVNLEVGMVSREAEQIYERLEQDGFDVRFDDRPDRAGEKVADADLIGIPARLTVSRRTLEQGSVVLTLRNERGAAWLSVGEAEHRIRVLAKDIAP